MISTCDYRPLIKLFLGMLLTFTLIDSLAARFIVGGRTFQEMFDKADLVVIGTARKTKDTIERKKLIDIDVDASHAMPSDELQDEVIGVETEFATRVILKGPKDVKKFLLHHYRLSVEKDRWGYGAPNLIEIPGERHGTFLMFLSREKDGRYAPVTGQFDPAVLSVFEIKEATPDKPIW
jgi:hypothetical protein